MTIRTKNIKCKLCDNLISIRTFRVSKMCRSCANKTMKLGKGNPNWKGDKVGYTALHTWIRTHYGKANKCENKECDEKSKDYDWANIGNIYKRNIKNFRMLCSSCHLKEHWNDGSRNSLHLINRKRNKKGQYV